MADIVRWPAVQILILDWLACYNGSIHQYLTSPGTLREVHSTAKQYSDITFSPFTEYYVTSGTPVVGGIISNPTKFDITQKTPNSVYYGAGVGLPFSQYASAVPSKTNDLWVQGATNWTQYVVSPVGTWLQLIAYAPVEGPAGFYEMIQTDTTASKYNTYQFNQGYNTMNYKADRGRKTYALLCGKQPAQQCGHSGCVSPGRAGKRRDNHLSGRKTRVSNRSGQCRKLRALHHEQKLIPNFRRLDYYNYIKRPDHHYIRRPDNHYTHWSDYDNL